MGAHGVLRTLAGDRLGFFCPGCKEVHQVTVAPHQPAWGFNGNFDAPTFTPSVLVEGVERITDDEHARIMVGEKITPRPKRCHSFVADGKVQFLGDCSHALAGQTVPLEAF